jgi:hypothetical protein
MDVFRVIGKGASGLRTPLMTHGAFFATVIALIAYFQLKVSTLEHCVGCLGYGHHTQLYSIIMPRIVAHGQEAVGALIHATNEAIGDTDDFRRMNTLKNTTFCLACIGSPEAEEFLAELLEEHANPSDFYDVRWYEGACFAYARCAGPRAVNDLVTLFEKMPRTEERDERVFLLVALAVTASKRGVAFTLDHMELLFKGMESGRNGSKMRVAQATAECLVFGTDPKALTQIPVYRDCVVAGAVWLAEPRPNDYTSEFFWTESSENRLRPTREIEAAWKKDPASIRKRWADLLQ